MAGRFSEPIPEPPDGVTTVGDAVRYEPKQLRGLDLASDPRLQWAVGASASSDFGGSWAASQAAGPPTVFPRHGDHAGAWAQAGRSVGIATLDLSFAPSDWPAVGVLVLETLGPGALFAITAGPSASDQLLYYAPPAKLWRPARALYVEFDGPRAPIGQVAGMGRPPDLRLWLDTDAGPRCYNEIDAVALVKSSLELGGGHGSARLAQAAAAMASSGARRDGGVAMANVYEMFWDCQFCDATKLLGKSHRSCPGCGGPQDPSTRYFPSESEKVAVANHIYYGADLICDHCQTPNSAIAKHCVGCGAPIGDGDSEAALIEWRAKRAAQDRKLRSSEWKRKILGSPFFRTRRAKILTTIGATLLLALVCTLVTLFWTRAATLEVVGHHWSRQIGVDRYEAVREGTWCSSMPSDGYGVSQSTRQSGTNQIPDGEECSSVNVDNGDGTYRQETQCRTRYRSEPVYDEWCDYTVDRWVHQHNETASGEGRSPPPYWPSVSVSGCASLGCTREGGRSGSYVVRHVEVGEDADDEDEILECDLDQAVWAAAQPGSVWGAEIRVITGGLVCDTLVPARVE